jgi:hypothetical protein
VTSRDGGSGGDTGAAEADAGAASAGGAGSAALSVEEDGSVGTLAERGGERESQAATQSSNAPSRAFDEAPEEQFMTCTSCGSERA